MRPAHLFGCRLAVLAALAIGGCETNRYEIKMTPADDGVQRELTFWRERTVDNKPQVVAFPADELAKLAAAYGADVPARAAGKHTLAGLFAGELPDDVGGRGSYMHWNTSLGSSTAYVERIRGNDDLLADVETRHKAADRIADLLIGWLTSELEGEAGFAELRDFMDHGLRRDLKNLSLYSWTYAMSSDRPEEAQAECLLRVGQYFFERSYFTSDQVPELSRAVRETARGEPTRLLGFVQRFAASKLGIAEAQPIPASLGFLSESASLEASINEYLRRTDEFQRLLEEWNREQAENPAAEMPKPNAVLGDLVAAAFLPTVHFGRADRVAVVLAATARPFQTNGQWDEQAGQVHWSEMLPAGKAQRTGFPPLLYAVWSTPDAQAQQAHFGRVVLKGSALSEYCLWYHGLSQPESQQWDAFVSSLRPADNLTQRLRAFRFSHEPPAREDDDQDSLLVATPRELILSALSDDDAAN